MMSEKTATRPLPVEWKSSYEEPTPHIVVKHRALLGGLLLEVVEESYGVNCSITGWLVDERVRWHELQWGPDLEKARARTEVAARKLHAYGMRGHLASGGGRAGHVVHRDAGRSAAAREPAEG